MTDKIDYFRGAQANHTFTLTSEDRTILDATFVIVSPDDSTVNVIIDFGEGEKKHIGCSSNNTDWIPDDEWTDELVMNDFD